MHQKEYNPEVNEEDRIRTSNCQCPIAEIGTNSSDGKGNEPVGSNLLIAKKWREWDMDGSSSNQKFHMELSYLRQCA
jgi:hypothetical protein